MHFECYCLCWIRWTELRDSPEWFDPGSDKLSLKERQIMSSHISADHFVLPTYSGSHWLSVNHWNLKFAICRQWVLNHFCCSQQWNMTFKKSTGTSLNPVISWWWSSGFHRHTEDSSSIERSSSSQHCEQLELWWINL